MNDEELKRKREQIAAASEYIVARLKAGKPGVSAAYPLNRGDVMILIMLIDRELPVASSDWTNPLNGKRLAAIREKLGDFAVDAPQMSKAEAQQFRE